MRVILAYSVGQRLFSRASLEFVDTRPGGVATRRDEKVSAIVSGDSGETAPDQLSAVMVCAAGRCEGQGAPTLDALRPLIARTPRAILVRTGCVHPHSRCPTSPAACGVRLQICSDELSPVEPSVAVAGTIAVIYREVQTWLDTGGAVGSPQPSEEGVATVVRATSARRGLT